MIETAICLRNARFTYPHDNFTLSCDELFLNSGEITYIKGKNGSGKTTLLKLCCGIFQLQAGTLHIFGEDAKKWSLGRIGQSIGYLFQEPSRQLFTITVWDEMTFIGSIRGDDLDATKEKALSLLHRFNMFDKIGRSTYRLSRGEKQRLALAAILMQKIRYLILDEPTTGLDRENKKALHDVIESLLDEGIGIAFISHDNEMIARYNKRQIMVDNGRVLS